ncbi:unnamed protein product [Candida verbasci]|uniref:Stationary phase protein 5 n=1 Tax=Candida verbasci TaxID=1227364 RepID=A0A9W4TXX2_9ASCO|nr:unnamed protein product [Candida verbasci]
MFKNILQKTRNLSRRLSKSLEELSRNLQQPRHPSPQFQPVRVPVHNQRPRQFVRNFSTYHSFNYNTWSYSRYYKSKILTLLKHQNFMFHNFSQTYQSTFRLKMYNVNLKFTYRTLFNGLKEKFQVYNNSQNNTQDSFNPSLRLNLKLSSKNHQLTLRLSKSESSATQIENLKAKNLQSSTFLEIPLQFSLSIPQESILSDEIVEEVMFNIKLFEKKLKDFKNDLKGLFDLGELPIKYISSRNVFRIYFPNCDRERLEILLKDKDIIGGVIVEEEAIVDIKPRIVEYDSDILSTSIDSNTISSDVLPSSNSNISPLSENSIIRPTNELMTINNISINDDYHWV